MWLIIINGAGYTGTKSDDDIRKLQMSWRVLMGLGILIPLSVFYFRLRMQNPKLYRKNAIRQIQPYHLILKRYWKTLLGTAGTWFLYVWALSVGTALTPSGTTL